MSNTCPLRITATAGTKLVGALLIFSQYINQLSKLYSSLLSTHSFNIAGSSVSSLSSIPHCCPPKEFGPCYSPDVAIHFFKLAKGLRLGRQLPTNNLILAEHTHLQLIFLSRRKKILGYLLPSINYRGLKSQFIKIVSNFPRYIHLCSAITHPCVTNNTKVLPVQLACVKHVKSIHSEPGSNSKL